MTNVADYLLDLIRIPSSSSLSNRPVIEYAGNVLHAARWTTTELAYIDPFGAEKINLIAAPPGQDPCDPAVDLALLCHTDTVPPASGWTAALQPFSDGERIYGCGACDVKGFLACLLAAAGDIQASKLGPGLRVALTSDEEIGCLGSHHLLATGALRPRSIIIGEPTSMHVARAGKGYCLGEITVHGAEAHSAHPMEGRSSIFDAARVIQGIEHLAARLEREQNSIFDPPHTTINIGTIHGGTAKNVVPAECRFLVEWRPIPGPSVSSVPDAIEELLRTLHLADPSFRSDFKVLRQQSGFETSAKSSLVSVMEQLTKRPSTAIAFGSEASVFASIAEEVIVFGPGDMRSAHSPRECVPISELEEAVQCIRSLLLRA